MTSSVHETIAVDLDLIDLYKDLHSHPELGFHEQRTSSLVERHLTALGFDTTTGVGTTGVVGVLKNGVGPTALLRADMDALPVREETGLDYASTVTTTDDQGIRPAYSVRPGSSLRIRRPGLALLSSSSNRLRNLARVRKPWSTTDCSSDSRGLTSFSDNTYRRYRQARSPGTPAPRMRDRTHFV